MSCFKNNKIFSDVLARYLNDEFGSDYVSIDPEEYTDHDRPRCDVDALLSSHANSSLFLQLKEVRDHNHTKPMRTVNGLVFTSTLFFVNSLMRSRDL